MHYRLSMKSMLHQIGQFDRKAWLFTEEMYYDIRFWAVTVLIALLLTLFFVGLNPETLR